MSLMSRENRNTLWTKFIVFGVGAAVMVNNTITAFATNPFANAQNAVRDLFVRLITTLTNVVVPIAGWALFFCLLMILFSTSRKKVETYREWAITFLLCIVGVFTINFVIYLT